MAETNTKSRQAIYLILILLLLITNCWLFYTVQKMKREKQDIEIAMTVEKESLQEELSGVMDELETFKEANIELDSTLQSIRIQIDEQTTEIENLLGKNRASRQELAQARTMLETLRSTVSGYKLELDQLKTANLQLNNQNRALQEDVVEREETIKTKSDSISQLQVEQEILYTKASILNEEKELLTSKVNRAAVLQASSIEIAGVKYKNSGKEVMVHNAKRVEKMKICFDIMSNPVAKSGEKEIMLRIVSPSGESLFVESFGSGILTNSDDGTPIKYTTKTNIDYNGKRNNYCMFWEQSAPLLSGNYHAELYNEGYLIGRNNLELK
ncbi:MAG: hypothetical protein ACPG49_03305 [Chitinophagales bacterium]